MVRHHSEATDDGARLAFRLSCRRCRKEFTHAFDDADHYRGTDVIACPSCMGTESHSDGSERARDFPDGYDVVDRTLTAGDAYVDTFDELADLPDGPLTDTQEGDYWSVEVDGKTGGERSRERGVVRGTVTKSVDRARRKVRGTF